MEKTKIPKKEVILNGNFKLIKNLGKGKFSDVFFAYDMMNQEEVALKYQQKTIFHSSKSMLHNESLILENLKNVKGVAHKKLFIEDKTYDLLILPIYKETLKDLYHRLGKFSLRTVIFIALELIDIIEQIHERNIIHLDLKPENIMIGTSDKTRKQLCIIDYGLAKKYIDENKKSHISFKKTNIFTGSYSYASLNSHLGFELSRRDDFESLGYILIYLLKGSLPWQSMNNENCEERLKKTAKLKKEVKIEKLCEGIHEKFKDYFEHVRKLRFEEKPDYEFLRGLFTNMEKGFGGKKLDNEYFLEWIEQENTSFCDFVDENEEYQNGTKISDKYFSDYLPFNNTRLRSRSTTSTRESELMKRFSCSPKKIKI